MGAHSSKHVTVLGSDWAGTSEDPTLLELRSHDIKPPEDQMIKTKYSCFGMGRVKHEQVYKTTNCCQGKSYSPCHADESAWDPQTNPKGDGCGDRDGKGYGLCLGKDGQSYKSHKCAKIRFEDPAICPKLGSTKVGAIGATSATPNKPADENGRCIRCQYGLSDLAADCSAVREWTEKRRLELQDANGNIGDVPASIWFHDGLMTELCKRQAPDGWGCPSTNKEYVDANGKVICSNLLACDMCREWAQKGKNGVNIADTLIDGADGWCTTHFDINHFDDHRVSDPSCRCTHIRNKPGMQNVSGNPKCWYAQCQDRELKTDLIRTSTRTEVPQCPESLCVQIMEVTDAGIVNIDDVVMDCGSGGGDKPKPTPGDQKSWWSKLSSKQQQDMIIGGSVFIGVVGLMVVVSALKSSKPSLNSK